MTTGSKYADAKKKKNYPIVKSVVQAPSNYASKKTMHVKASNAVRDTQEICLQPSRANLASWRTFMLNCDKL